jgi:hypothetical protein
VFGGSATLNGLSAPNGTIVTALIDGAVAATTTTSGGSYAFIISQPFGRSYEGKTIQVRIGGVIANQVATWTSDGGHELNLTATSTGSASSDYYPYFLKGKAYFEDGKHQLALNEFTTAISLKSYDPRLWGWRAVAYHYLGQYQRAIEDLDKAIQLDSTIAVHYQNRGNAYSKLGQYKKYDDDSFQACLRDTKYC